jgi:hypothetical protein
LRTIRSRPSATISTKRSRFSHIPARPGGIEADSAESDAIGSGAGSAAERTLRTQTETARAKAGGERRNRAILFHHLPTEDDHPPLVDDADAKLREATAQGTDAPLGLARGDRVLARTVREAENRPSEWFVPDEDDAREEDGLAPGLPGVRKVRDLTLEGRAAIGVCRTRVGRLAASPGIGRSRREGGERGEDDG